MLEKDTFADVLVITWGVWIERNEETCGRFSLDGETSWVDEVH